MGADLSAKYVGFKCADDYYTSIDMATALHPQTVLALTYDGQVLPAKYGYPVKLRMPTKLGYKNPKHIRAHLRHQHVSRRLLGRPGLQLVRRQLSRLSRSDTPAIRHSLNSPTPKEIIMNKFAATLLSACLSLAAVHAVAQDAMSKDAMAKDAMTKDAMSKDAMKKDAPKDAMKKDAMANDAKKPDAMAKDAMSKDAMSKDAMKKDAMKKDAMKKDGMAHDATKPDAMAKDAMAPDAMKK